MLYKKKNAKRIAFTSFLLTILLFSIFIQIPGIQNSIFDSTRKNNKSPEQDLLQASETDYYTTDWIKYGNFSAGSSSYWDSEILGDTSDLSLGISSGVANYEVTGEKRTFSLSENPIVGANWLAVPNPNFPGVVDENFTDSEGLKASHTFTDDGDANQNPSIHWDNNCTMPVDMSDYEITSASIQTVINATVSYDVDVLNDYLMDYHATDGGAPLSQFQSFDYVRFYVLLSDLSKNKVYEVAYYQNDSLGYGDPPGTYLMSDKNLITVPENVLIFYLTSILSSDNFNFTVTLGIRIYAADSSSTYDTDTFTELLFKSVNLTFTYEKKINQLNRASWKQDGDLVPAYYEIENATLNFKYMINASWSEYTSSPNSEFRILINNNQLGETVNLNTANGTLREIKQGGFDVTPFISPNKHVNLTIQVYIGDEFLLNSTIKISIDDVSLQISYGISTPPDTTSYDLFLNDVTRTMEKSTQVTFNENLNITLVYKDSSGDFIPGADVELTGSGFIPITLSQGTFDNYYTIINSTDLGVGMSYLTLTATKRYYSTQQFQISIEVINRDTEIQLFLDMNNLTIEKEWTTEWNENLNITIRYRDIENAPSTHIGGATVELTGIGSTKTLDEDLANEQYEIVINTFDLGVGSTFLTVYASKENYTSLNIRFKITVIARATFLDNLILNTTESNSITIAWNELFDITVSYNDTATDNFIDAASLQLIGTGYSKTLSQSGQSYILTINSYDLSIGNNFLTLLAQKDNYSIASRLITITVEERPTTIESILNYTSSTAINFPHGELLNITAIYKDLSGPFIDGATVELREGSYAKYNLTQYLNQYSVTINTTVLSIGVNLLTLYAKRNNYSAAFKSITITINERDTSLEIYLDRLPTTVVEKAYDESLNITVVYKDFTDAFIDGANCELRRGEDLLYDLPKDTSYPQYERIINTKYLNLGTNLLAIYANQENYSAILASITVIVREKDTLLDIILANFSTTIAEVVHGEFINITAIYKDNTSIFIEGAVVELRKGANVLEILTESLFFDQYGVMINSSRFSLGANILSIYAKRTNYSVSLVTILIIVNERQTTLDVYLNGFNSSTFEFFSVSINTMINITAIYEDFTSVFISGATVELTGTVISETLLSHPTLKQYYYSLNLVDLGVGVHFLVISADSENYTSSIVNIKINVLERGSNLELYINGDNLTSSRYIAAEIDQTLNVTVYFTDSSDSSFISSANLKVIGALNDNLTENAILQYYNISIRTNDLDQGINFLTIFAQKQEYVSQSIVFTIEVIEKASNLQLFLNGNNETIGKSIEVTVGELVNISVIYEDYSKLFIDNAEVIIVGEGIDLNLTQHPIYDQYNVTIDSDDLNFGINLLTLYAKKANYQPQTLIVRIEIIEKETDLHIFLNGLNKTIDRTLTLPIRSTLNVTVKYFDYNTSIGLSGATIQLIGEGLSDYLTENPSLQQYSISVDTTQLDIGVRFLTIYAQRANYQSYSALLRIQVDRIRTNITTVSRETVINRQPGQNYRLEIELLDLDFNTNVLNATVTYTWTYGQGTLTDPEDDGIYEGTISNLVEGTFVITISVYAGDDYEFERFTITLNVVRPAEDVLLFQILTILGVSAALGLGGYLFAYQRVLKYPKQVRKIRKYKSKLKNQNRQVSKFVQEIN